METIGSPGGITLRPCRVGSGFADCWHGIMGKTRRIVGNGAGRLGSYGSN